MNNTDTPYAITGDAARRMLFALFESIKDFRFEDNYGALNDVDLLAALEIDGYKDKISKNVKKFMPGCYLSVNPGYQDDSTLIRPDGVVSRRFAFLHEGDNQGPVVMDMYGAPRIKTHDVDGEVQLIGHGDDQVVQLGLKFGDGSVVRIRVSSLGKLMEKDSLRMGVLEESINRVETPWGKQLDEQGLGKARVDLERLQNRHALDLQLLQDLSAVGYYKLPWGEEIPERYLEEAS